MRNGGIWHPRPCLINSKYRWNPLWSCIKDQTLSKKVVALDLIPTLWARVYIILFCGGAAANGAAKGDNTKIMYSKVDPMPHLLGVIYPGSEGK